MSAIFDDRQHILLSQRADLGTWTLPGGRLDEHEPLAEAAAREVQEETGIAASHLKPFCLVYMQGWKRMNVMFRGQVSGGSLHRKTDETRANAFAPLMDARLPAHISSLLSQFRPLPMILTTPSSELRRVRAALARRYVWNWLRGKPEPRYPRFQVRAVGLFWEHTHRRVVTIKRGHGRALPRVLCDGLRAPWVQLGDAVRDACGLSAQLTWVGVWEDAATNQLEFVFAASLHEAPLFRAGEWTSARNAALPERDLKYLERTRASFEHDPIWMMQPDAETAADMTITSLGR
ncbi:MAG: NUDIX domain-containing protein [Chloroflexota bacterium]|nr:NUDIX domain-containing protein [Chloroflexota bacterium]